MIIQNRGWLIVSNMNKRTRDKLYPIIAKRDGEYCRCCGKLSSEEQLVIDHKDNDNSNNTHTNLQLLCRACNYLKNPRKEPLDSCVSNDNVFEERLSKFKKKEIKFLEYLDEKIENSCTYAIDYKDAINSGAEIADISVETAKRHLKRVISSEGKFRKHDYDDDRPSVLTKRDPPRGVKEKLSQNILWSWV